MAELRGQLARWAGPMRRRLGAMVRRAVLELIDDESALQRLQATALAGETLDGLERVQQYGFTSHPHPGAAAIVLALGGNSAHSVVIAVDDRRYRLAGLAQGEVALYDDQGQKLVIYRDRIEVEAPKVVVKSPDVHLGEDGGPRVARVGDRVNVGSGSSAGLWPIVEGSENVRASGAAVGD
ncbi:MAG: phage baseplate assembly protein V [Tistlia sp.]|uniref:phage baseplate assembly protein V n=1 Tax=Tistlia sp. TaxID=3057121 RepID=UPI0034A36B18